LIISIDLVDIGVAVTIVTDQEARDATLTIRPLQPTIGAEVSGVDLRNPITDAERDQIKAAVLQYKVVFFRDQFIDQGQHAAFARRFGPLYTHPSTKKANAENAPAIHNIAARDEEKYAQYFARQQAEGWDPYHSDTSWRLVPTWGAVLRAVNLPDVGGDTIWVDAGLAYERLPEDVRQRLEGLHVTHDYRDALVGAGHDYPIVAHPILRTHRETGKKILFVNFTEHPWIVGLDRHESRKLLSIVHDQYRKPEFQVRFSWRPGSIAFWDNRAAVHYAVRNYDDFPRLLERILIADDPQYADL
jgi:alpha-ketoglutarate-dependent sulfate ester dioxygenase